MSKLVRESINEQFHKGKDPYEKYKVGTVSRVRSAFKNIEGMEEYQVYNNKVVFKVHGEDALRQAVEEMGYDYNYRLSNYADIFSNTFIAVDPSQKAKGEKGPDPAAVVKADVNDQVEGYNLQTGQQLSEEELESFMEEE